MASAKRQHYYPDHLNPFGSDDEDDSGGRGIKSATNNNKHEEYPDHLSPFGDDEGGAVDDYDDSLNPFGDEQGEDKIEASSIAEGPRNDDVSDSGEGNPFVEDDEEVENETEHQDSIDTKPKVSSPTPPTPTPTPPPLPQSQPQISADMKSQISIELKSQISSDMKLPDADHPIPKSTTPQPESLELPPVPLPRTKSLLKKEQAQKNKQHAMDSNNATNSLVSTTSSTSTSSTNTTSLPSATSTTGTFQKRKNKRNAPPVPINFKRQVSGSLDAIEEELNEIGDELAIIEKESSECQQSLKVSDQVDETRFAENRSKFIELIKRKNSIVRRQKELMYRKRELKLDQIHSDIEYELRMIGNKQLSHRTSEDDIREKELLKKLVEIVEEKSDIVENLNKDSLCDSHDIGEAFRRLNLSSDPPDKSDKKDAMNPSSVPLKNVNCDKSSATMGVKLSKIATLLPKGGTLKGTMKIKRKRLFKKV